MKRVIRILLLTAVLAAILCIGVLATEIVSAPASGVYHIISKASDVSSISWKTADGKAITSGNITVNSNSYTDFYANAAKFDITFTGVTAEKQYLVLALNGTAAPTAENIVYIDQKAAGSSETTVTFAIYPSSLKNGNYSIYLVGDGKTYTQGTPLVSFSYYQSYKLGDVDGDGYWTANDALYTLQIAVNKPSIEINGKSVPVDSSMRLAANTDGDSYVTANDALLILQKAVGKNVF
jgi:hypothetical protein